MRKRAVSLKFLSNTYLYYENKQGIFFSTVEELVKAAGDKKDNPTYKYTFDPQVADNNPLPLTSLKNIVALKFATNFDTISAMKHGYFSNRTLVLSPLTQSWQTKDFGVSEVPLDQFKTLNGKPLFSQAFIEANKQKRFELCYVIQDANRPPVHDDILYGPKCQYMTGLSQRVLTCRVPGDSCIHAGDVIFLDINEWHGFTPKQDVRDKLRSSAYLIGTIKHSFDTKNYFMTMDLYTDSFPNTVESVTMQ